MRIPAKNVFELAARQGAMNLPLRFRGQKVGSLAALKTTEKIDPALMARLDALYRLGFDFSKVTRDQDLAEIQMPTVLEVLPGLALGPGAIPGVDIKITGRIKRDSEVAAEKEPYFVLKLVYQDAKGEEREIGYFHTLYQREARSLSLYTCGAVKIDQGRHLPKELISRGFLTAAKMARALGEDPVGAFAFYILDWLDLENKEEGIVRPAVQGRIDKLFGILRELGFYEGFPTGAKRERINTGAMQIPLKELEANFKESWWQWAYVERFGSFSDLLDKEELTLRLEQRETEDWKIIAEKAKYWLEGDGAKEKIAAADTPIEDLLTIFEDREINFDLADQAFAKIMGRGEFNRETMIRMVNVLRRSQFDPASYADPQLKDAFYRYLPRKLRTLALKEQLGLT